nr:uncharacterized protein LOC109178201 [Ipomoea batatas]
MWSSETRTGGQVIQSNRVLNGENPESSPIASTDATSEHHADPLDALDVEGDVVMEIEDPNVDVQMEGGAATSSVSVISTHPQFVILQVRNDTNNPWFYAVVYGSPTHHLRRRLWAELTVAKQNLHGSLLVAGDFNVVTNREDTDNYTTFSAQRSSEFAEWIHSEGLVDMGYIGPKFTWVKILSGGVAKSARLDRALCNVEGRQLFPEVAVSHLPRVASDHAPILIRVAARTTWVDGLRNQSGGVSVRWTGWFRKQVHQSGGLVSRTSQSDWLVSQTSPPVRWTGFANLRELVIWFPKPVRRDWFRKPISQSS